MSGWLCYLRFKPFRDSNHQCLENCFGSYIAAGSRCERGEKVFFFSLPLQLGLFLGSKLWLDTPIKWIERKDFIPHLNKKSLRLATLWNFHLQRTVIEFVISKRQPLIYDRKWKMLLIWVRDSVFLLSEWSLVYNPLHFFIFSLN